MVNAANAALAGGRGVDGAIHRVGGPEIPEECRAFPYLAPGVKCPTGEVRSTTAGRLRARWVIHAVGPIHDSRDQPRSRALLESAYRSSLVEGMRLGARTLAFPSLSTGAYRYPLRQAAEVALSTVLAFIEEEPGAFDTVTFALFSPNDLEVFETTLAALTDTGSTRVTR
ncbi:MAG: macro domain-containing protein [Myxococcales bacterium]|nr:macro domain-containing protein [Myxococcales bacterium]